MENIFLIETVPGGLRDVRAQIGDTGAVCRVFGSVADALKAREDVTLIVLLADKRTYRSDLVALKLSPEMAKVPRLSIFPPEMSEVPASGGIDGETVLKLPVERGVLLDRVATMQKRSLRRVFETVVNLRPNGTNIKYTGRSLDFSRTGMAFESQGEFSVGQKLTVSFVDPSNRKRFALESEVVRMQKKIISGTAVYGIRFVNIGEPESIDLMNFIAGKGRS